MKVTVLKNFRYAADGVHIEELAEGKQAEIRDRHVKGLVAAGYVSTGDAKADAAAKAPEPKPAADAKPPADAKAASDPKAPADAAAKKSPEA